MPDITLHNRVMLPPIGLGVFQTPPEETRAAVAAARQVGYRHVDTAAAYGNEREVGEAVHASPVDRDAVFLETKIWISDHGSPRRCTPSTRARPSSVSIGSTF